MLPYHEVREKEQENTLLGLKCLFHLYSKEGLYPGQPAILLHIRDNGPTSPSVLAKHLGVSTASVGVSIKRLEHAGYVRKQRNPNDLRYVTVSLTPKGAKACCRAEALSDVLNNHRLAGFTEEELQQFTEYLARINHNLADYLTSLQGEAEGSGKH